MTRSKHRGGDVPAFGQADPHGIAIQPKPQPPATSWWLGVPPDEFTARHRAEVPRMQGSRFGQLKMLITPPSGGAE